MIYSAYWASTAAQEFSDDAKLLGAYLLSCTHGTIAGVCRLSDGYVSDDLAWTPERVSKGFTELFEKGFANRCETTKWVWVRKFLEWNTPENPNQWKATWKVIDQIPQKCVWRADFLAFVSVLTGKELVEAGNPSETVTQTVSKPHTHPDPDPDPHSHPQLNPPQPTIAAAAPPGPVDRVFDHWRQTHGHLGAKLDAKRKRRIVEALKAYTEAQLCDAVSGYRHSPHHMGTDPKGQGVKYDDIELFLRGTVNIERGLQLFANPPRAPPKAQNATERILSALKNKPDDSRVIEHEPDRQPLTVAR